MKPTSIECALWPGSAPRAMGAMLIVSIPDFKVYFGSKGDVE
jgi:hypothetical protein